MKSEIETHSDLTRRDFIKKSSAGVLGLSVLNAIPQTLKAALIKKSFYAKSRIVLVKHSKVISPDGIVDSDILDSMLDTAISNFNGDSPSDYWNKIFSPKETIGLKVNTLGLNSIARSSLTDHFSAITNSIIKSFKECGYKDENFIIWDRSNEELTSAGFNIQNEIGKTRTLGVVSRSGGSAIGYHDNEIQVESKSTRITKILTDMCDGIINIPLIKDHGNSGFTGALKNHYGTINNARDFHNNNCTDPGIPEINMIDVIRKKQRLIIVDALMCVFNGGPRWERRFMWPFGGILVGTDPVAVDTVLFNIMNEKRKRENLQPIHENHAIHISLASEIGLGTNNMNNIDLVEINLG